MHLFSPKGLTVCSILSTWMRSLEFRGIHTWRLVTAWALLGHFKTATVVPDEVKREMLPPWTPYAWYDDEYSAVLNTWAFKQHHAAFSIAFYQLAGLLPRKGLINISIEIHGKNGTTLFNAIITVHFAYICLTCVYMMYDQYCPFWLRDQVSYKQRSPKKFAHLTVEVKRKKNLLKRK